MTSLNVSMPSNRTKEVAPFLRNLRRILDCESESIIRWTRDGLAFEIHDLVQMTNYVLPKYFKHHKYTSFQRQLNYFHFRKWTKSRSPVCTFSNPYFVRHDPGLAWHINRKKAMNHNKTTKTLDTNSMSITISQDPLENNTVMLSFPSPCDGYGMMQETNQVWNWENVELMPQEPMGMKENDIEPLASNDALLEWVDELYHSFDVEEDLSCDPALFGASLFDLMY